jgi:hypothetical protein
MNLIKVLGIIEGHGNRDTASRLLEMAKNQDLLLSQPALEEENQARRQRKYSSTTSAA